jgi:hypothetical protein
MPCNIAPLSRDALLELAFSDIPSKISTITLRRLSAGSFTLLGRLGNPMIVGKKDRAAVPAEDSQTAMFDAAIQYIWVHSADIETVLAVETVEDIPVKEIRALAFEISIGEAFAFLARYQESALRASASLAEVEPEEDDQSPGKLPEVLPVGSPPSSTPAEPAEIPHESATSSGSCPSSEPSPTSTLQTSPTEPAADGPSLTLLPDLAGEAPEQIPPN